jgi:hypothetical protein
MARVAFIVWLLTISSGISFAGKIEKGYQALEIYNYFEAKKLFEECLDKNVVPAAYGLSIIYFRTDNPFHNIDSAYNFIIRSFAGFPALDLKSRLKIKELGVDSLSIVQQRERISEVLYIRAINKNTVDDFNFFISKNFWSTKIDSAVFKRDSLAFLIADTKGQSKDYEEFMNTYPTSYFAEPAASKFEHTLYLESTASNTLLSYLEFVKKNPASPYRTDAEDKIFELYTQTETVDAYHRFIADCPDNHNVNEAWRKLYNTHVQTNSYSENSIEAFTSAYPAYPFLEEIKQELLLADQRFFPIKTGDLWGFVNEAGLVTIPLSYEEADNFSEGLAVVKTNGKYGYINKSGTLTIDARFDDALPFHEGHAVVELKGKLGMINRSGEFIIPAQFEDLGNLTDGLTYFLKDSLYGYFDSKGIVRIPPAFTDAFDYKEGKAIVSLNHFFGLIDKYGTTFIPMKYDDLRLYQDQTYLAMSNEYWGLISISGDTILPFEYDYIGPLSCNRALVEKENLYNYVDPKGNFVLTTWLLPYSEFRQLANFKNGFARIEIDAKYVLIDTTGKRLFAQPKENLGDYSELIAVSKTGKWGYYTPAGVMTIPHNFTLAGSFSKGFAIAGIDPFYGLINKQGQYILEPYYEDLNFLNDTLLIAKSHGNYGLINVHGDTLLNFVYISIEPIDYKIVKIEEGDSVFYYDILTNKLLRKEEEE